MDHCPMKSRRWQADPNFSTVHGFPEPSNRRSRTASDDAPTGRSVTPDSRMLRSTALSLPVRADSGSTDPRGSIGLRRARKNTLHVAPIRQASATPAPGREHRKGVRDQNPLPYPPFMGVFRSVVRNLEHRGPAGRPGAALQHSRPGALLQIRSKQYRDVDTPIQSATATSLGDRAGIRVLPCPSPGNSRLMDLRKSRKSASSGESDQISHPPWTKTRRSENASVGFDTACTSRENTP